MLVHFKGLNASLAWLGCVALFAAASLIPVSAGANGSSSAQSILHALDYIAADYAGVTKEGQITNAAEYAEQLEFATRLREQIGELPDHADRNVFVRRADDLIRLIRDKKSGDEVATLARVISRGITTAYGVTTAPKRVPDPGGATTLFEQNCGQCHGPMGFGDGPQAKLLQPKPSNFHNRVRHGQHSVYSLYNTITLGVAGTAMPAFAQLSEDQRWALAFLVSNFSATSEERSQGEKLWRSGASQAMFPDLQAVTSISPIEAEKQYGEGGRDVLAFLRSQPRAVAKASESPLAFSARALGESLAAYTQGERAAAQQLAVNAYLEGYELVEATLDNVDRGLRTRVEREMMSYRNLIKSGAPVEAVRLQEQKLQGLLSEVKQRLDSAKASNGTNFFSAFLILLREGIEAILILSGITAFLIKTQRRDALPYIHAGWISALGLGTVTWFVATRFINISGANRELTEGITAILSAAVLLYVGYWLHGKVYAKRWKEFIETKLKGALSGGTLWGLAFLAFFTVYREVFETVLFYESLWVQVGPAGAASVIYGFVAAAATLGCLAWLIFAFSVRLPIRLFFGVSSILIAVLAIVFTGKGIAALQGAGKLPLNPIDFPPIPVLGIYPNVEGLVLQALILCLILGGYAYTHMSVRRAVH